MPIPVKHKGGPSSQGGRRKSIVLAGTLLLVAFWWTQQPNHRGRTTLKAPHTGHKGAKEALHAAATPTEDAEALESRQVNSDAPGDDAAAQQPPLGSGGSSGQDEQGLDAVDGSSGSPGAAASQPSWSLWSLFPETEHEDGLPSSAKVDVATEQQPNPLSSSGGPTAAVGGKDAAGAATAAAAAAAATAAAAGATADSVAVAAPLTQGVVDDRAVDLARKANRLLSRRVSWRSAASPFSKCRPDSLQPAALTDTSLEHLLRGVAEREPQVVWTNVTSVPCSRWGPEGNGTLHPGCCSQPFSFRVKSTDILVFQQIFRHHYLRALYVLLQDHEPRYILDAGANAGFSTALFKLLWPNATVVSLEPDPSNFAALQRNTAAFEGVHRVRAGLWGRRANITQVFDDGDWGKIFKEMPQGQPGLPAFSVADIAAEYGIPGFDYVKIDIEGAEGMVFAPGADISWIQGTKLVSLEVHDSFAKHFGLKSVTGRVDAAFNGLNYSMSADNEHIFYIHADILPTSRIVTRTRGSGTTASRRPA